MRLFLTLLICFGLTVLGRAQNFKYNSQPKGVELPVQNVLQMEQDTLGRMWFSTPMGIYYSDGIETFPLPDSILKEFNYRISIHKDENGIIWLYNSNGLPKLVKGGYGSWEFVDLPVKFNEKFSSGISLFSMGKGHETQYFLDTKYQLIAWDSSNKVIFELDRNFEKEGQLGSILIFRGEILLFFEKGVFALSGDELISKELEGISLPSSPFLVKWNEAQKMYYFLGREYLAEGKNPLIPEKILDKNFSEQEYSSLDFYDLFFDQDAIFYHFNSQLFKFSEKYKYPLMIDLRGELRVYAIHKGMIDREGILWVGTSRGLVNFHSLVFQNYGIGQGDLLAEEVTAIGNLGNGEYLYGFNNGIQKYSRLAVETIYRDPFPDGNPTQRIVNFNNDGQGTVWFSSNWGGVGKYNIQSGKINLIQPPPGVNISFVKVEGDSLIITGPGNIYISSIHSPSSKIYDHDIREEVSALLNNRIFYMRKAGKLSDGRIVVMKASQTSNEKSFHENDRMLVSDGYDFLELEPNRILFATESGLKILEDGEMKPFRIDGQSISRPVYALLKDSYERLWAGTDDGVFLIENNTLNHFNEKNGLIGNEINRGALLEASQGRIMIGTLKGISLFFSGENYNSNGSPSVIYHSIVLDGERLNPDEELEFPYEKNSFEVDYSAIGFNQTKDLWVYYRLNPENDWSIIKDPKSTALYFTNLPYGNYQLELKASYEGENFSKTVTSAPFSIQKPIYLQTWFILLWVLFLIALGILISTFFRQFQRVGVLKSAFDQKSKEKQIAEVQFKNVWTSSKDGLMLTIDGRKIVTVNPSFAQIVKMEVSELENTQVIDLFSYPEYFTKYISSFLKRVLKRKYEGFTYESTVPWKSGDLEMEVFSILIQENFEGKNLILSVFRDVSSKKAIEQKLRDAKDKAEQANRYKTSMLSNISHEIRTPLNGILGGTEHIMMMRKDDAELISQLDIILQSGERLLNTITSLLDIAKIEANKMNVMYTQVDINSYLATIVTPLKNLALRKGLVLKTSFLKSPFIGKIDKRFIEMILNNLISNAIKYTDQGEIKLTVDKRKNNMILSIEDSGVGMSEEFLRKAFQPFEQESTGNQRLYEGTGLGLNITKNLVTLLNGEISIQSSKDTGTTVTLEIPLPD
ncbi:sensor histidine kinase [Algoriphagus halophilus]|uniref:histidine kinase n=1 Tax=Algoriphagus halophilus TaxID=226505 RepID=A0A1N6D480_9BACT|nr:PAS domain-containing sensor histidine kinase [Algoriphagus halophilus]SIN65591.1 PAS domain S-box-containing protein [Algoriphagus halophilus]